MTKVVCFGELLIDFVALERGISVGYASHFEKAPGGAPANVAVGLARLGIPTAFITQLGDDPFGHFLEETLRLNGVDTSGVVFTTAARTALAFVSVEASGERSFTFYRNPSADMLMTPEDLNHNLLREADIFHFGSITLIDEPMRSTTLAAIQIAHDSGTIVSYDPNLRNALWPSSEKARAGLLLGLHHTHVVKMNEEELAFLTGATDFATPDAVVAAARQLWHDNLLLFVVTRGSAGCIALNDHAHWLVPGFSVQVEDTIGCGDGFMAGILEGILPFVQTEQVDKICESPDLTTLLKRANAIGALTATKRGAIPALPDHSAVEAFLAL